MVESIHPQETRLKKLPIRMCIISQYRVDDLDSIPGKPISEAKAMAKNLETVVFLCYNEKGGFHGKKLGKNLYIFTVPITMDYSIVSTLKTLPRNLIVMGSFLVRIINDFRINFIRADNVILGGIPTILAKMITQTKYAIWLAGSEESVIRIRYGRGLIPKLVKTIFRIMRRYVISKAECVFSVSKQGFEELGFNLKGRFWITPNYVDLDRFTPKKTVARDDKDIIFLYVGRLESEKGIEILIEAIGRTDFKVKIAGWGTLLTKILRSRNSGTNIVYLGKIAHEKMPEVYRDVDVLVLPSLTEGMPAAVLEAMASGVPVIASKVGQLPHVIEDEHQGLLINPGSSDELIAAMNRIANNPKLLQNMSKKCRDRVEVVSGNYMQFHLDIYSRLFQTKS